MAKFTLSYQSSSYVDVPPCGQVMVGFKSAVASQLDSGKSIALARVTASRILGNNILKGLFGPTGNARGDKVVQYDLEFDDAQFTSPFTKPTCGDILDITPYTTALQYALA